MVRNASPISRLSYIGFGGVVRMGAATGQLSYAIQPTDTRTCLPMLLEGCICEQPKGQSLEICYPNAATNQAVQLP